MACVQEYFPSRDNTGRVSSADLILTTMTNSSLSVWGFVLVRCSYADETKWEAFLADIKEQTLVRPRERDYARASVASCNRLNECLRWAIIEDCEKLEGASMQVASARFEEWVKTAGHEEVRNSPRCYFGALR